MSFVHLSSCRRRRHHCYNCYHLGHCAKKATTVIMDYGSNNIIHLEVADARETDNISGRLEKVLLERCLGKLRELGVTIHELVTDASRTVISMLGT